MKNYPESENGWIVDLLIVIATGVVVLAIMAIVGSYTRRAESAAYLKARYDLDHATAWHYAADFDLDNVLSRSSATDINN